MKLYQFVPFVLVLFYMADVEAHDHPPKATQPGTSESAFIMDNQTAMDRMMTAMEVKPSGNIDDDFVAMMTPHHQGAIDMAIAELRYGSNPQLRRIAQEIIVTQQQEITAMYQALNKPLPPAQAAPDQIAPANGVSP
ncbi:MAG: DUF305 domain-containing protein [Pantoea sp.]|uniref:DUF305 domain-containing protein n=1 Tax=Pantoea sp. TaxID=69393 RepID=UPI00238FD768|nr:DUF305 domain-containing protein [Pantoea sp.]MDE1187277.1 DUF305 domain-containing protein [Pantoea sp.]